jgi:hypothetical protein
LSKVVSTTRCKPSQRVIEMTPAGINIFPGNYEDHLAAQRVAA